MASRSDQPPADERTYDSKPRRRLFWHRHRTAILLGGAVILAIAAAVEIWFFGQPARAAASSLFAEAWDDAAWRELISKYPKSTRLGMPFLLADSLRSQGKLDESSSLLSEISFRVSDQSSGRRRGLELAENLAAAGKAEALVARGAGERFHQLRCAVRCFFGGPWFEREARGGTQGFRESRRNLPATPPGRAAGHSWTRSHPSGAGRRKPLNRRIEGGW